MGVATNTKSFSDEEDYTLYWIKMCNEISSTDNPERLELLRKELLERAVREMRHIINRITQNELWGAILAIPIERMDDAERNDFFKSIRSFLYTVIYKSLSYELITQVLEANQYNQFDAKHLQFKLLSPCGFAPMFFYDIP